MDRGPLHGLRVLELASLAPAPFGCMILADLGADVMRVERAGDGGSGLIGAVGPLDRGRRVDRREPADAGAAGGRAAHSSREADVLVEGFRPGVAERLGHRPGRLPVPQSRSDLRAHDRLGPGRAAGRSGPGTTSTTSRSPARSNPIGRAGERPVPPLNLLGDFGGGGDVARPRHPGRAATSAPARAAVRSSTRPWWTARRC